MGLLQTTENISPRESKGIPKLLLDFRTYGKTLTIL